MTVAELINLMGTLSLGNENISAQERAIYLQYLNLAHLDLYSATANLNQSLLLCQTLENEEGASSMTLPHNPFLIDRVYIASLKKGLKQSSLANILAVDPDLSQTGDPQSFYVQKDQLWLYPHQTSSYTTTVWYVPNPAPLTENTPEEDIPYPIPYHPVLADGALYYVFQDEGGFKNTQRESQAKARWQTGKARLLSYLYYNTGYRFSTFRSV